MALAAATPAKAPAICAETWPGTSDQESPPCEASARVTTGLKWPPQIGPKVRIRATSAAPVASRISQERDGDVSPCKVFSHDAGAHDRRQQEGGAYRFGHDLARGAHRSVTDSPAATTRTAAGSAWLLRPHEGAHELAVCERRNSTSIDPRAGQKLAGVLSFVHTGRLDINRLEPGYSQLPAVLGFFEGAGDATDPQFDTSPDISRHVAANNNVGEGKPSSRLQHPEGFA